MQLAILIIICLILALPSLLCCLIGGWYLFFGAVAIGIWGFLLYLVVEEWFNCQRQKGQEYFDNP